MQISSRIHVDVTRLANCWHRRLRVLSAIALTVSSSLMVSPAQVTLIGNQFIQGVIFTSPPENRFTINSGPAQNNVKFLYGANATNATSNIVFRIESGGNVYYYTNCSSSSAFGWRPIAAETGQPATFKPFDSLYESADTVAMVYKNMSGWNVTQRWIAEKPRTIYDDGTDLVLEFSVTSNPFAPPGNVGVFMMLDLYNGEAGDPNPSDFTSVITDRGYFPRYQPGKRFDPRFDTIPSFCMTGNVTMQPAASGAGVPYNIRMPIHRLTGLSQGGKPLTTPDMFAIGDWRQRMREYSWEAYSSEVGTTSLNDVATCVRWANLTDGMTARTAFGMNNRLGNNIYTCRDTGFFVMMRTERIIEQRVKNGAYSPASINLEVWVVNLDNSLQRDMVLYFQTPIQSDRGPNRLLLDPSTPATQGLAIPANGVKKVTWKLNFNPAYSDDSANVQPELRYAVPTRPGLIRRFKQICMPTITIKKFLDIPPPMDTVAPTIARGVPGRTTTAFWPFTFFDRHPGYKWDCGLDGIRIDANDGNNFRLIQNPAPFKRCDTNETVSLVAEVIDTSKAGRIVFSVFDCRGNISQDSAIYNPRPDIFPPVVYRIDSSGSYGPACNAHRYDLFFIDSINQRADAGDNGLGAVSVVGTPLNYAPPAVNFDAGGVPIGDFDRRASVRLAVVDTLFDGHIDVRIADYAGNADTLAFDYCTLPDVLRPQTAVVSTAVGGPWTWSVDAADSLEWDRGLDDVVVLSNPGGNMDYVPPLIALGDRSAAWSVSVVDDRQDASIVFEVRDAWYRVVPEGHADTVRITFVHAPDTLAPNIVFNPVSGTGGSRADVSVNDIHYFGGQRYRYDTGLDSVIVTDISPNLQLVSPIVFTPGDSIATFSIRIVDTLALYPQDSICLRAVDRAGNSSTNCYRYPITPDELPPIFTGRIDPVTHQLTGVVRDDRLYDRGLGSITIVGPVNLNPAGMDVLLAGDGTTPYTVDLVNPEFETSGTLVIRDLVAVRDNSAETDAIHAVRIPFTLPTAHLKLVLPQYVQGGDPICATIVATAPVSGASVDRVEFEIDAGGAATWVGTLDKGAVVSASSVGPGRYSVVVDLDPARAYATGDTLGSLVWLATSSRAIETFNARLDTGTLRANGGVGVTLVAGPIAGDTAVSRLELPPPLYRMSSDSLVFINGECERFLTTDRGLFRPAGLAILGVRPLPVGPATAGVEIDIRDVPADGAVIDLVDAYGNRYPIDKLEHGGERLVRRGVMIPFGLPSGVYLLRVASADEAAWVRIPVVR